MVSQVRFILYISLPFMIILFIIISPMALAYPGQGDCMIYHIPVKMKPLYDPGANLVLDGIPSESFWEKSNNLNGTAIIPLSAEMIGNNTPRVVNLSLSFVMNDEYLYVLACGKEFCLNQWLIGEFSSATFQNHLCRWPKAGNHLGPWQLLNEAPLIMHRAACSRSADSSTTTGGLPGPPAMTRLPVFVANSTTRWPPVTAIRLILG